MKYYTVETRAVSKNTVKHIQKMLKQYKQHKAGK